jgi:hypothetical protein
MKIFRKRILPKIWLSAIAIGVLFLGFAGATVKASNNQPSEFFSLTNINEYLFGATGGSSVASTVNNNAVLAGETLQFSQPIYAVNEGDGTVTVTVTRTGSTTDVVSVTYFTTDGTATGAATCNLGSGTSDYITATGTLTFQAGVTSQTFSIQICNDTVFESNPNPEGFNVNLVNPTNGALLGSQASAIVQITDNDAAVPGNLGFAPTAYLIPESAGTVQLTVSRGGGTNGTVSATITFANQTAIGGASCATPGVDFINTPQTVTFTEGQATANVSVTICDDANFEGNPNETFTATLSGPTGGATINANSTATITIDDDDANVPGTLNFNANSQAPVIREGTPNNNTVLTLTVLRTVGTSGAISATVSFANGTATGGAACGVGVDFINTPQTISFAPQQTSQTIQVTICDDNIDELPQSPTAGETFQVILGNPQTSNGAPVIFGANSTSTVTILDTDNGIFQVSATTQTVGEGDGFVQVTVTRTGGFQGTATVDYTINSGTATGGTSCTAGVDFIFTPFVPDGTLTFAANISSQTFLIQICEDSRFETGLGTTTTLGAIIPETFTVTLSNPTGGAILGTQGLGPGTTNLTNQTATPIIQTISITENDLSNNPGTLSISPPTVTVNEGAAGVGVNTTATFTFTRDGNGQPLTGNAGFNISPVAGGSAVGGASCAAGIDYITPTTNTLIFTNANGLGAGNVPTTTQTGTITITVCNDTLFEGTESVTFQLTNAQGNAGTPAPTFGTATATLIILDDDANAGTITVGTAEVFVSEAATFINIPVMRSGGTNGDVSIPYSFADGPASAGPPPVGVAMGGASCTNQTNPATAVDYINTPGTVTFANSTAGGTQTATITVQICNDTADESPDLERFRLILGPQGGVLGGATIGADNTATIIIQDDEQGTIQFSPATYTVTEGTNPPAGTTPVTLTVTRANTQGTVTVQYTLNNGTGANGAIGGAACAANGSVDFINPGGAQTLTFGQGVSSQTFTVLVCADAFDETDENFTVTLSNPGGGALLGTATTATVTITDDDATPSLSINDVALAEGNAGTTNFVFTVTLGGGQTNQAVTVNFATADGTATGGAACGGAVDYVTTTGTLTFAAGTTTQQITVPVCGDLNVEANETFFVNLTAPTGANATISDNQGIGGITNDDGANGTISIGDIRIVEGNSGTTTATVTLNLTGNPNAQNVTVNVTTSSTGGTATGGAACGGEVDYITNTNGGNPITFNGAGNSTQTFTVTICGDTRKEANEIFFINLSGASGNATIGDNQGFVIIIDDDRAIRADFDIDRKTDLSVFRPSNGTFYIQQSFNGLLRAQQFGTNGDIPTPGDYDGDRATDVAYYRPSNNTFNIILSSTSGLVTVAFGAPGDIPVPGDYNGDGATEVAVFRPSSGTFFTSQDPQTNFGAIQFGANGDVPVPADYDGDGRTDVAVFRPGTTNATWFVRNSSTGASFGISYGAPTDIPVTGDIDGDGKSDFTVFRTGAAGNPPGVVGAFYTFQSLTQSSTGVAFGQAGDIPAVGDYDGDGRDDIAVYRPNSTNGTGTFFILGSTAGFSGAQFGANTDIPIPSRYQAYRPTVTPLLD